MSQWLSARFTRVGTRAYIPRAHINPGQCGSHLVIPTFGRQMLVIPQANWLAPDSSEIPASMSEVESNWERPLAPASSLHTLHMVCTLLMSIQLYIYTCAPHKQIYILTWSMGKKERTMCFELELVTLLPLPLQHTLSVCVSIQFVYFEWEKQIVLC